MNGGGGKRLLSVPLPRIVTGIMPRCRTPEHVVVLDDVPMLVPDLTDAEAPVAIVTEPPPGTDPVAHGCGAYRIRGTDWYAPVEYGDATGGCAPDDFGAALVGRIGLALGLAEGGGQHDRPELAAWADLLGKAAARRGLLPPAAPRPSSVEDDGRAGQAAMADFLGKRLAVIDGRVHHRVPAPAYRVTVDEDLRVSVRRDLAPMTPHGARPERPEWATTFPVTRLADARRLADAVAGQKDFRRGPDDAPFEILSPWQVTAAGMEAVAPSPEESLTLALMDYAEACRDVVGRLDDEGLALYAAFRSGSAWASVDEALEALDRLAACIYEADVRYCADERSRGRLDHGAFVDVYVAHMKIVQRLQAVEGPLWGLSEDDLEAMATLGPVP